MPPKHIMFIAQDLGQKLGLPAGTDLVPLQEALLAAYHAGINDALYAASTSGAGPHVLGAIEGAKIERGVPDATTTVGATCNAMWGGGRDIHVCTREKGHHGECWWPGK